MHSAAVRVVHPHALASRSAVTARRCRPSPARSNRHVPAMARVMEKSALAEVSNAGEFKRTSSVFRDFITQEEGTNTFAAEAGRYHLYVSLACPWAHRCLMVLSMKGLWSSSSLTETAPVVGVSVVHPTWARTRESDENDLHRGWQFVDPSVTDYVTSVNGCGRFSTAGCTPDAVHGVQFVRDLYNLADPSDSQGKYTVPILWDTKRNTIVNNESSEILRMLNDQFNAFATTPTLDLYPAPLRTEIDQINQWTYEINNGVYKCGFATSQQAYDQAEAHLYAMLDKAEELLGTRRYLCGDALTECDVRVPHAHSLRCRLRGVLQVLEKGPPRVPQPLQLHQGRLPAARRGADGGSATHHDPLLLLARDAQPVRHHSAGA